MSANASDANRTDESVEEALREGLGELQSTLQEADQRIRSFVTEKPLWALGGALVAGYAIGRLLARR